VEKCGKEILVKTTTKKERKKSCNRKNRQDRIKRTGQYSYIYTIESKNE